MCSFLLFLFWFKNKNRLGISPFAQLPLHRMRSQVFCRRQVTTRKKPAAAPHVASRKAVKPQTSAPATSLGRTNRRRSVFPPELYRTIIEWVTNTRDLCNLALASRTCYAEAQRVLYRAVDLAQNTRAPVLWASTILHHPHRAAAVRALTLRFDLSFLIVPHMLLSSLKSISQALGALRKLKKLVLIGHPLAMMHPIHTWILDGCTANLEIFHNSVFPPSAIVSFLSRQPNLRQWKQNGVFPGGIIADTVLPHLTVLDAHASTLSSFRTPRPLVRVRLKIEDCDRLGAWERTAIEALSLFGSTLSTLTIEYSSAKPSHFTLAEVLRLLAKATPNLKILVYTKTSAFSTRDPFTKDCAEQLSDFSKLEVLVIQLQHQLSAAPDRNAVGKRAFERCPSLRCLALRDRDVYSYTKRQDGTVADENLSAFISEIVGD